MRRKVDSFMALCFQEKILFLEAFFLLGWMRAAILLLPFRYLTRKCEHKKEHRECNILREEHKRVAAEVGRAIARASGHTPWESACLAQALTACRMLRRRGISGVFYLGVKRDAAAGMKAHAWSRSGDVFVTGEEGYREFTVVSAFCWESGRERDEDGALFR